MWSSWEWVEMLLLMIDNYDSFTYNLVQELGEIGVDMKVVRNDAESVDSLLARRPDGLVISPGPGAPEQAGVSVAAVQRFAECGLPVLGVCLGHQSIGAAFGARIVRAGTIMHGKTSLILHQGQGVLAGLPQPFEATRYHSLVIEPENLPEVLDVTARTESGEVMAIRHKELPVEGVQFHPESILTKVGRSLLQNFVDVCENRAHP